MKFTKMQGCGNDYIYVDCTREDLDRPGEVAKRLSDRHFGIGADGLILIRSSKKADFRMSMYNADGSEGAMCGNGIRCVGRFIHDHGLSDKTELLIETKAGIKKLSLGIREGEVWGVRVDMGAPILKASKIPVIPPEGKDRVVGELLTVDGREGEVTCVSMGNPHCVVFVDEVGDLDLEEIGPGFEHHPAFPDRVNTEFVQVISRTEIAMRVWERGSGETLACGTGACASVVACLLNGLTERVVTVHLLGGDLVVEYDQVEDTVYLTGPAETVFTGEVEL